MKHDPRINEAITRAAAAWPSRLPPAEVLSASLKRALADDSLFCRTLQSAPISDVALERLVTNIRHALLATSWFDAAMDDDLLRLSCAVARQCFINEYIFSLTADEAKRAEALRAALDQALAVGAPCPASWPILVGSYCPLHTLANAAVLLARSWPPNVRDVLVQQIEEPIEERRLADTIPALTEIGDGVSQAVRRQYEENPYPRWTSVGPPALPPVLKDSSPQQNLDILVAGCGTGLMTIELARSRPKARILAVDLSLASLGFAKRMAQSFKLANIEFAQADIMKLAALGREKFDFIDASGMLHHLADPWAGWRLLLSLLRSGGVMQVGLYSAAARRNVVAVRELIVRRGYQPTPTDIRRCREEILATPDGSLLKSVVASPDFFSLSACRDLLFHVQEHRMTLPEIKEFLVANGLEFTGFILPPPIANQFRARFPDPSAATDLDSWGVFEYDAPQTFAGMYQFGVRNGAADRLQSGTTSPELDRA